MNPFSNTQFLLYMETLHDRDENIESLLGISMCTSLVSGGALLVDLAQGTIWFHKNETSSLSVTTFMSGAHHFETAEWEIQQKLDHSSIKICLISANNKITWIIQIDQELQFWQITQCQCRHSSSNVAKHTYYRAVKDMQGDTPRNSKFWLPYICIQICNLLVPG